MTTAQIKIYNKHYYQLHKLRIQKQSRDFRLSNQKKLKEKIFKRFGHRCAVCGSTANLTLDHVYPLVRSKGYAETTSDRIGALVFPKKYFQILCRACNTSKAQKEYYNEKD